MLKHKKIPKQEETPKQEEIPTLRAFKYHINNYLSKPIFRENDALCINTLDGYLETLSKSQKSEDSSERDFASNLYRELNGYLGTPNIQVQVIKYPALLTLFQKHGFLGSVKKENLNSATSHHATGMPDISSKTKQATRGVKPIVAAGNDQLRKPGLHPQKINQSAAATVKLASPGPAAQPLTSTSTDAKVKQSTTQSVAKPDAATVQQGTTQDIDPLTATTTTGSPPSKPMAGSRATANIDAGGKPKKAKQSRGGTRIESDSTERAKEGTEPEKGVSGLAQPRGIVADKSFVVASAEQGSAEPEDGSAKDQQGRVIGTSTTAMTTGPSPSKPMAGSRATANIDTGGKPKKAKQSRSDTKVESDSTNQSTRDQLIMEVITVLDVLIARLHHEKANSSSSRTKEEKLHRLAALKQRLLEERTSTNTISSIIETAQEDTVLNAGLRSRTKFSLKVVKNTIDNKDSKRAPYSNGIYNSKGLFSEKLQLAAKLERQFKQSQSNVTDKSSYQVKYIIAAINIMVAKLDYEQAHSLRPKFLTHGRKGMKSQFLNDLRGSLNSNTNANDVFKLYSQQRNHTANIVGYSKARVDSDRTAKFLNIVHDWAKSNFEGNLFVLLAEKKIFTIDDMDRGMDILQDQNPTKVHRMSRV